MTPTHLEHARYRVIPRASKKLAIFFSGTGPGDHEFQWWKVAHETDASLILVNNGRNEWYQLGINGLGGTFPETVRTFKQWADNLGASDIYCVGSSMGGSAALMYGAELNARVLAFGAETRFDYPVSNCKRLLAPNSPLPYADLKPMVERSKGEFHLISGEGEPIDLICAKHVQGLPNVTVRSLRGVGHDVAPHLRKTGALEPLMSAFVENEPLPEVFGMGCGLEGTFAEDLYDAWCAVKAKDWSRAESLAQSAVAAYPEAFLGQKIVGHAMLMQGRAQDARAQLVMAIGLDPDDVECQFLYATAVKKCGDINLAMALHEKIVCRWPKFGRSHYDIGMCHLQRGERNLAISFIERAAIAEPNRKTFSERLAKLKAGAPH